MFVNTEDSNRCHVNANVRALAFANCSPLSRHHQFPGQESCPDREQWFKSVTKCKSERSICSSNLPYCTVRSSGLYSWNVLLC